ncbi:putative TGACG-sequence-specific DNA-binding protein TGA-2.1-like [Capsicum annuum]|nr:putative TGACG-sequence-specific DNA-binding protein TGA-2.1-like [Capsicum annuum]
MVYGICEMIWLKKMMEELKKPFGLPIKLYCDNKVAISIAYNPVQHDRTKYVEVDRHFIKEEIAAIFTKSLFKPKFETLPWSLGQLARTLTNSTGYLSPPTSNRYQVTFSTRARTDWKKSPSVCLCWELNLRPHGAQPNFIEPLGHALRFSNLDIHVYLGKYSFTVGEPDCIFPSLPSISVLIQLNPSYTVAERQREMHEIKEQ